MDKDTAVKPQRKLIVQTAQGWYDSAHNYSGNPDYSPGERLLFMENALNHTENALFASNQKIAEQEKYAELGRLSLTTRAMVCSNSDFIERKNNCENHCTNYKFCQKRAELLAGEKS